MSNSSIAAGGGALQSAPANAFVPPGWLGNAHLHTIFSTLAPRRRPSAAWRAAGTEVTFELPDGDRLLGFLHPHPDDPERRRPVVVLLHGLEGSADTAYMRGMSGKAFAAGFHSLRLNFRNCGGTERLSHSLYHSGNVADVVEVMTQLVARHGFAAVIPVGVSFGGNILLQVLGNYSDDPPPYLLGAVAISAAIDLAVCAAALRRGFNRVYEAHFLRGLARRLRRKQRLSPRGAELGPLVAKLRQVRSLYEFDDLITAPHGGFAGAADYYARCSSGPKLGRIRVPTLLIHAQDDPFVPFSMYRDRQDEWDPRWVSTAFPARGGHAGFLGRPPAAAAPAWMDGYWAEDLAIDFCHQLIGRDPGQAAG